jgi:hypothetical protein
VAAAHRRHRFEVGARGDAAGGVGRAVEQQQAGARGDRAFEQVRVDEEVRGVGVEEHRPAAEEVDQVLVHHEVGIGDHHLVAVVDQRAQGQEQPARDPGGHQGLLVVPHPAGEGLLLGLELGAQFGDALGLGVGVAVGADGGARGVLDLVGDREVGLADRQVDRVLERLGEVEDAADAAGVDAADAGGELGHGRTLRLAAARAPVRLSAHAPARWRSRYGFCVRR